MPAGDFNHQSTSNQQMDEKIGNGKGIEDRGFDETVFFFRHLDKKWGEEILKFVTNIIVLIDSLV